MDRPVHIGLPVERVLTYDETCALTWPDDTSVRLLASANANTDNEKVLIPIEAHQAVVKKIQTDANEYSTTKSYGEISLDLSVIQMQVFQLVNLAYYVTLGGGEIALVVLLCLSLCLQFLIGTLLVLLAKSKTEKVTRCCMATGTNSMVTILTWLLLIIGFAISAVTKAIGPIVITVNATTANN
jgi:hypothetical protein